MIFRLSTQCLDGSLISQDVEYHILPSLTVTAGSPATYCPGSTAFLNGSIPGSHQIGEWTGFGNGISAVNRNLYNTQINISAGYAGATTLVWTVTDTLSYCTGSANVVITNLGGIAPVTAGPKRTLSHCYSTTQSTNLSGSFAGNFVNGQGGTWTIVSGPTVPSISNIHANNSGVSGLVQGTYVFRWTVNGPCASGTALDTIIVPPPTANLTGAGAGASQIFCDGRTQTVLNGNPGIYINEDVLWTQIGGPTLPANSIVCDSCSVTPLINLDGNSTYTFRYNIHNDTTQCSNSDILTVSYLNQPPTLSITTKPIILSCNERSDSISYISGGLGSVQYRIYGSPIADTLILKDTNWVNASNPLVLTNKFNFSGKYLVQFRNVSTVNVGCGTSYDEVEIFASFGGESANAGTDQILDCNIDTTSLQGNDPKLTSIGEGEWSQISGPSTITFTHPTHHNPTFHIDSLLINQHYSFLWYVTGGQGCPDAQDTVTIITGSYAPNPKSAGPDQLVCYQTPVYLHAQKPDYIFEVGTWTVSPNTPGLTISNIHDSTAVVNGLLPFTDYTFYWTIRNSCAAVTDSVLISVNDTYGPKTSLAGIDRCLSSGTTQVTLNANDPTPGSGQWNKISGPLTDTITSPTLYNTTVRGLIPGTYFYEWVISRNVCTPTRDTVMITVNDPGAINANAGSDISVCGSYTTLTATGSNPALGSKAYWSQLTGNQGPVIASPDSASSLLTNLRANGSPAVVFRFLYTITNGACISKDTVAVFVSDSASVANITLDSIGTCGNSTVSLSADPAVLGSGYWSIVSGPNTPFIETPSSPTTSVNNLITGNYVFRWTISGGPYCESTFDSIKVRVIRNANAGSDQNYCEVITAVNLVGTVSSTGSWTQMDYTPDTATITSTSANTATASGLIPGVYNFIYSVSEDGCVSTDTMKVTLYTPPSTSGAGNDTSVCSENTSVLNLNATAPASGSGKWTKLFAPVGSSGSFDNDELNNAIYTPAGPDSTKYGLYVFQWTVSNQSCSNADQVRIEYCQEPSAAVAGADQNLSCSTTAIMTATNPAVGLGTWTLLSRTGDSPAPTILNPLLYNTEITGLGPKSSGDSATYTFLWTVANGVCDDKTDTVNILVFQTPTPAYAGVDQSLCMQTSVILTADTVSTGNGAWRQVSPAITTETFSDTTLNVLTVSNIIPGNTYKFLWLTETAYCSSTDTVTVINYQMPDTAYTNATDTSYCSVEPLVIRGNKPAIGSGIWTQISGNPLIILSPTDSVTSAVGGEMGQSYTFRWTISNFCGSSSSDVTVVMNGLPPQAQAGIDKEICAPDTSTTLSAKSLLSASYFVTNPLCFGDLGSINVYGSGGIAPYTYKLDGGSAQASGAFTNLSAGDYSVTVKDQNSCSYVVRFTITVPSLLAISNSSQTNVSCRGASTASVLLAASGGTAPYTFSVESQPSGASPSINGNQISGMKAGNYTIRVTDNNACTKNLSVTITQPSANLAVSATPSNPTCNGGNDGSINTTVSGGNSPYTYQWSNGDTDIDPSGLMAGTYTVNVRDANGCTVSDTYTVSNPAVVTITATSINNTPCDSSTGSAVLTSSDGSDITVNGITQASGTTFSGLAAGLYKATSSGSCPVSGYFSITRSNSSLLATASITNPCFGGSGSVTITPSGGTLPNTYLLDGSTTGSGSFSGLGGGIHNVLVTDSTGCTYNVYFTITIPTQLTISLSSQTDVKCKNATTGTALLKASGGTSPYTFSVSAQPSGAAPAVNGNLISNMKAGSYTIRVTDANGCTADQSVIIDETAVALNFSASATMSNSCYYGSNGSINITVSGGTTPYNYAWSNGAITEDPSGLKTGYYSVSITDANSCLLNGGPYYVPYDYAIITESSLVQTSCLLTTGSVVLTSSDNSTINFNGLTLASGSSFIDLGAGTYIATSNGSCPATSNINMLNTTHSKWTVFSKPSGAPDPVFTNDTLASTVFHGLIPGIYKLVWSNINGECTSSDTMLVTVFKQTTTANAGPSQILCNATSFNLYANAKDSLETGTWVRISGPNNPTITSPNDSITNVTGVIASTTPYVFRWKITSGTCPSTEDTVSIINRKPITLAGPSSSAICVGGTDSLYTIASNGSGSYNYLWEYKNGLSWDSVGNTSSYVTPVLDSIRTYYYRISVSDQLTADNGGCSIIDTAYVQVVNDPVWESNTVTPDSICKGGQVNFNATISGGLGGYPISWIRSATAGGIGDTVTSPDILSTEGNYYYRPQYVTIGKGCNLADDTDSLVIVVPDPVIDLQPTSDTTICKGTTATLSVSASGGTPYLTYQWQYNTIGCGGSWTDISGATNSNYTTAELTQTTFYHVVISASGSDCNTVTSNCETVYVPRITNQPTASQDTICINGNTQFTVSTEVGSPAIGYTYQWQYDSDPSGDTVWANVVNGTPTGAKYYYSTTNTMTVDSITPTGKYNYRVLIQVTSPSCNQLVSDTVSVTVKTDPNILSQPLGDTICNGTTASLSVSANGGTPVLYYQWQISTIGSPYTWTNIGPNTPSSNSLTTAALTSNTWYRVEITSPGSNCNTIYSDSAKITVNNLNPGTIAQPDTVCSGGTPAALISFVDATPAEIGAVITYKWQSRTASTAFADIAPPATASTYAPGALTEDTWYRRIAYSTIGISVCQAYSNTVKIVVNNLNPGVIAATQTICSTVDDVAAFTVATPATTDGSLSYQWQISSDSINFTDIASATSATYDEEALTADKWYQRITKSTLGTHVCYNTSNIIAVYVNNLDPGSISGGDTLCRDGDPELISSAVAYSGDGDLSYQWYYSDNGSGTPPSGWTLINTSGTSSTYDPPSGLVNDRWYSRLTTSTLNGKSCTAATNLIRVTVNNVTSGSVQTAQTICDGITPALLTTATAATNDGILTYQWQISADSVNFTDIAVNGTNETYQPLSLTQDTWFKRKAISTMNDKVCDSISRWPGLPIFQNHSSTA